MAWHIQNFKKEYFQISDNMVLARGHKVKYFVFYSFIPMFRDFKKLNIQNYAEI